MSKPKAKQPQASVNKNTFKQDLEKRNALLMEESKMKWDNLCKITSMDERRTALGLAYNNNPYIQNQRVKRVSSQPFSSNRENLEKALKDIQNNEQLIRQTSASLFANYPLLKLNNLYADILSYRWYPNSIRVPLEQMKEMKYKKEKDFVNKWCKTLKPRQTFQNIVLKVQREGKVAYYMRDSVSENRKDVEYAYLQELPSDYIKIVGWNTASKFTVSFDFTYFWQAGTSPMQFPPIFQKYYKELNDTIPPEYHNRPFKPDSMPSDVDVYYNDNKWFYWRTLPLDECFVFSQDESQPYQVPNTAGLFLQAQDLQDYAFLQQELLQLPLSGGVFGTLPMATDSGGTVATNNFGIDTDAFSFFTDMFNEIAPKGMQLFMSPAKDFKFFKFEGDAINNSQIQMNALQQFNAVAGVAGINTTTDKPNMAQVKSQQIMEAAYVAKMYPQFESFVNTWWKNKLKLSYEWRFNIKGSKFEDVTDFTRVEKGLSMGQNYLLPEYASYFDLRLEDVEAIQNEVISSGIYGKLEVVQSAFNTKELIKKEDLNVNETNGRPKANEDTVESDGTASSISQGSNTAEGRYAKTINYCAECGEILTYDMSSYPFCSNDCKDENLERVGGNNE